MSKPNSEVFSKRVDSLPWANNSPLSRYRPSSPMNTEPVRGKLLGKLSVSFTLFEPSASISLTSPSYKTAPTKESSATSGVKFSSGVTLNLFRFIRNPPTSAFRIADKPWSVTTIAMLAPLLFQNSVCTSTDDLRGHTEGRTTRPIIYDNGKSEFLDYKWYRRVRVK